MILANHGATRAHIIVADEASAATWRAAGFEDAMRVGRMIF